MDISSSNLRTIGVDVKAVARKRGSAQAQHPLLPQQVLALTQHWLALGGKTPPHWAAFNAADVGDVIGYLTVLRCNSDGSFTFTFMGSAVSAVLGEDLTGCTVTVHEAVLGEVDWYQRCKPVADVADIQLLSGSTNPPYTSPVEFIAADFPFMDDAGGAVSHIVGVTVAKLN